MFQFDFDSLPGAEVLAKMTGVNVRFRVPKMVREDGLFIYDVEVHGTIGKVIIVHSSGDQIELHPDEGGWTVKFEAHVIDGKEGHAGHFTVRGPLIPTK